MNLAQVKFGRQRGRSKNELENIAEGYLVSLLKAGQLGGEYLFAWTRGVLNAYVRLVNPKALQPRYHSPSGKKELAKVNQTFGEPPRWVAVDDDFNDLTTWRNAPFLYLFTHAFDWASPVCHGGNGRPIPTYVLPLSFADKEKLFFWQEQYSRFDRIYLLDSGPYEIAAYRQLANAKSELTQNGRELCRKIEEGTKTPTYYYLHRYWGRRKDEEKRRCPGCGGVWKVDRPAPMTEGFPHFPHFDFSCEKCRLVSEIGPSTDGGRLARIGEHQPKVNRRPN